jgi:hypothetical protein
MYTPQIKFTPVGEYLRLAILRRLARGPVAVEEIDALARRGRGEAGREVRLEGVAQAS